MFTKLNNRKLVLTISLLAATSFLLLIYLQWGRGGLSGGAGELAKVNGHSIYMQDIKSLYEYYKEKYKDQINNDNAKAMEKQIMMRALSGVIQRILILQEAEKAKVHISGDQIFNAVARKKEFRTEDGRFNIRLFERLPKSYKQKLKKETEDELKIQFFQMRLLDGVKLSDLDVRIYFQEKNTKCKIRYAFIKVEETQKSELLADSKVRMQSETRINKILQIAKKTGNLISAAASQGVRVKTTGYFTFFGKISDNNKKEIKDLEVEDVYMNAFRLRKPGQISGKISLNNGFAIVQLINKIQPDWKNFYKELYTLRAEYEGAVKQWEFRDWYSTVYRNSRLVSYLDKYFK